MTPLEHFKEYQVVVGVETEDGASYPIVETQLLDPVDVITKYDYADEDCTLIKKKDLKL